MGMKFGDPASPLLVSVRSGAAVSMPGMMDTVLNLGLNDEASDLAIFVLRPGRVLNSARTHLQRSAGGK